MRKKIMIIIMLMSIVTLIYGEGIKMMKIELKMSNNVKENFATDKFRDGDLIIETEIERKIYKIIKPVKLFEGKRNVRKDKYFLEVPFLGTYMESKLEGKQYVTKAEYDRNPSVILNEKGRPNKDILIKELPVGTLFELQEVILDSWHMSGCYYYVKLLSEPEYKDIKVDAAYLSIMAQDGRWVSDWDGWFVNKEKREIKKDKIPLIYRGWAVELTKAEYKKYRETGTL